MPAIKQMLFLAVLIPGCAKPDVEDEEKFFTDDRAETTPTQHTACSGSGSSCVQVAISEPTPGNLEVKVSAIGALADVNNPQCIVNFRGKKDAASGGEDARISMLWSQVLGHEFLRQDDPSLPVDWDTDETVLARNVHIECKGNPNDTERKIKLDHWSRQDGIYENVFFTLPLDAMAVPALRIAFDDTTTAQAVNPWRLRFAAYSDSWAASVAHTCLAGQQQAINTTIESTWSRWGRNGTAANPTTNSYRGNNATYLAERTWFNGGVAPASTVWAMTSGCRGTVAPYLGTTGSAESYSGWRTDLDADLNNTKRPELGAWASLNLCSPTSYGGSGQYGYAIMTFPRGVTSCGVAGAAGRCPCFTGNFASGMEQIRTDVPVFAESNKTGIVQSICH